MGRVNKHWSEGTEMIAPLEFEKSERQHIWLWRYACFKNIPFLTVLCRRNHGTCSRNYVMWHLEPETFVQRNESGLTSCSE